MIARLFPLLLVLLVVPAWTGDDERATSELLAEVLERRDACDVEAIFEELGSRRDRAAFDAMVKGISVLSETRNQGAAYHALRHFAGGDPKLEGRVVQWLDKGLRRPVDGVVYARARALAQFRGAAEKELRAQLERQTDDTIRGALLEGLFGILAEEGSAKALELVLANGQGTGLRGEELRAALEQLYDGSRRRLAVRELTRNGRSTLARQWLIEAFAKIPGPAVDELLGELVGAEEPEIAVAALEGLGTRLGETVEGYLRRGLSEDAAPIVRGTALRAALVRPAARDGAALELERWASSKDPAAREAAAHGLAGVGGDVAWLLVLLADEAEPVRAAALAAALSRRDKAVLPALIQRLGEDPALVPEVARVLRLLTGLDFGDRPHRWMTWWIAEGDAFVLPRAHDARRQSEQQVARRLARERSSFYGLRIQGKGITFVLDGSDSMRSAHQLPTVGADGVTLLENLGDEVAAALTRLEDGQLFNLIFFGTSLERFAPRLVKLGATNRGEATRFVRRTTTLGATDLRAALEAAFEDPGTDTILLVTDGAGLSLLEQDRLLSSVRKWNRRREVVIHGIDLGFGGVPEVSTLFKLSELTGGTFRSSPPLHQRDR